MRLRTVSTRAQRRRSSFTLVELLTVLAIITIIIGLSISAVVATINLQHIRNTKFAMQQIHGAVDKQRIAVAESAAKENWNAPAYANALAILRGWSGGDDRRTRVMWVKFRLKQEFPTSYSEALNPYPMPPKPEYVQYLNQYGITGSSASSAAYESSACLYMALTRANNGTNFKADQLGGAVRDFPAPSGTIKVFTDDWTNPLVFARWPYGDPYLQQKTVIPTETSAMSDNDDRDGRLIDSNWQTANPASVSAFQQYAYPLQQNGAPYAYYLIPVIVSAGPDGQLGLSTTADQWGRTGMYSLQQQPPPPPTNPAASDNIYSYNLGK